MSAITNNNDNGGRECPICRDDDLLNEANSVATICGHIFHPSCLDQWLAAIPEDRDRPCPICRAAQPRPQAAAQPILDVAARNFDAEFRQHLANLEAQRQDAARNFEADFQRYLANLEAQRQEQPLAPQQQQPEQEQEVPPGYVRLPFSGRIVTEEEFQRIRNLHGGQTPRGLHV